MIIAILSIVFSVGVMLHRISPWKLQVKLFIGVSIIVTLVTYLLLSYLHQNIRSAYVRKNNKTTILMMYYPEKEFTQEQIVDMFRECPDLKCEFTHDERAIADSAAVIIHNVEEHLYSMPKRQPGQLWLYYDLESPGFMMGSETATYLTNQKMFNGTINYSPSSQVWLPYGKYNGTHIWIYNSIYYMFLDKRIDFAARKNKLLFWAVSNCYAKSKRQDYVKELIKNVKVDIYGGCGPLNCPRSKDCENTLFKTYKFYLAFENYVCQDYITEKLWLTLATRETVPIVIGGANHEKYLPPKSYIDIRDFATPADLANYLQKLDKNDDLYNEYFSWRYKISPVFDFQKATPKQPLEYYVCQVCRLIHTPNLNRTYVDFVDFNNDKRYCRNPSEYYKGLLPGY
ncbi:unnamed protein product [Owenia fusiformis]|uniref:Fucosyltransferase n=1 Tax=Owenia fusiformis TaxID=6347 RepID=A0A8J1TDZ2_OWEFU|nr:unnamed protein product [Owenia fusiformis]